MKPVLKMLFLSFLALSFFSPAFAQKKGQSPCAKDAQKFCKDIKAGDGQRTKCLKDNRAKLSSSCKTYISKVEKLQARIRKACSPDVRKLCKGVQKGEGKIIACLKENKDKLSPACKKYVK
ncbi:MAG: hypothetical protein H7A25_05015 [Leptospiraceae bacterium]|nr:hypothetical protein [Leptospiraceae bacterium]